MTRVLIAGKIGVMKVTSLIKGLVLAVTLACVAQAQQMVIWVTDDSRQLDNLLKHGWTVVHVAMSGGDYRHVTVFVLESPAKETTK